MSDEEEYTGSRSSKRRRTSQTNKKQPAKKKRKQVESESESDEYQNGESEQESEEEVDEYATEKRNADEAEVGIIERIKLENFMCHKHLEISFGPNINFLVGVNGSGKSAVLVALTICLGAKTNFTNRGKLCELIRSGAKSAVVTVQLRNRGSEAYHPKQYGPSIIVERRMTSDGQSGYKIKNHKGKTVSTTRRDLSVILEQFNIQINNPCAVLMQDTSRRFLNSSKPKDKYAFFLKATQLEQMVDDFKEVTSNIEKMSKVIKVKEKILPDMQNKLRELERQYEDMQQVQRIEEDIKKKKEILVWTYVKEKQDERETVSEQMAILGKKFEKISTASADLNAQLAIKNEELAAKTKEVDDSTQNIREVEKEKQEIQDKLKEITREHARFKSRRMELEKRLSQIKLRQDRLRKGINDETEKAKKDYNKEKEERLEKIFKFQEKLAEFEEEQNILKQELQEKDHELKKVQEDIKNMKSIITELQHLTNKLQHQEKEFILQKKDAARTFGEYVPELLERIEDAERHRKWIKKPLGPIGLRLTLKDDRWGAAIEAATGGMLNAFIVDNQQDNGLLQRLAKQINPRTQLVSIVQRFQDHIYRIPDNELPPNNLISVFSMIETQYPMIINALIDQTGIEKKVLLRNNEEAKQVMYRECPRNAKEGFVPDGGRFWKKGRSENFVPGRGNSKRLGINLDEKINESKIEFAKKLDELNTVKNDIKNFTVLESPILNEISNLKRKLSKIQYSINLTTAEIKELENFKEDSPVDVSEMENNLNSLIDDENSTIEQINTHIGEESKSTELISPYKLSLEETHKKIQILGEQNETLADGLNQIHLIIKTIGSKLLHLDKYKSDAEKKKQALTSNFETLQNEYLEVKDKAQKFCDEISVGNYSSKQIKMEIDNLERRVLLEKKGKKSKQEITKLYNSAKKKYDESKKQIDKSIVLKNRLDKNLQLRVDRWDLFRKSIARRTTVFFNIFLGHKGYSGDITFDHKKKDLNIRVSLDSNEEVNTTSNVPDTRTLSGGERSFSTVALLLALWEAMECPFRAMDEFDVFMDAVNRRISLGLLIDAARSQKHRQFIFITPHEISHIDSAPDIRIHKMYPPERAQETLNFGSSSQ